MKYMKKFFFDCESCDASFKIALKNRPTGHHYCFFCGGKLDDNENADTLATEHEIELQDYDDGFGGYDELNFDEP